MADVLDFIATEISNASIQVIDSESQLPGEKFGCMGTLEGETETRQKIKNCEGSQETITIPLYQTVTVGAHIKVKALESIFGIRREGLKKGVRKYGIKSRGKKFIFTADTEDEFENTKRLIAFPNCSSLTGMVINIDNEADEVAYTELEFRANPDEKGEMYYDAFVDELDPIEKENIINGWHTDFNLTLVEEVQA